MSDSYPRPSVDEVRKTFLSHYAYYGGIKGEIITQQLRAETATAQQYAGRVELELLQNALDACDTSVWIGTPHILGQPCLVVGNDGAPVSVDSSYNYESVTSGSVRKDFHALCSLFTSNKTADQQIGNKGVGFRSVFSVADTVQVWSRAEAGWWGMELQYRLRRSGVIERRGLDPALQRGAEVLLGSKESLPPRGEEWPSFYFPQPLWSDDPPISADGLVTLVIVRLRKEAVQGVSDGVAALRGRRLHFVGLRDTKPGVGRSRQGITVRVEGATGDFSLPTWPVETTPWSLRFWPPGGNFQHPKLEELRKASAAAGVDLARPGAAVSIPSESELGRLDGESEGDGWRGSIHAYLATDVPSPVAADVHADFGLGLDRKNLELKSATPLGKYNKALVELSAEIYAWSVLEAFGLGEDELVAFAEWRHLSEVVGKAGQRSGERSDVWRLLSPSTDERDQVFRGAMERILFTEEAEWDQEAAFSRWSRLAARFFNTPRPIAAFKEFWSATERWRNLAAGKRVTRAKQYGIALALCDALRTARARVVPLADDDRKAVQRGVPLPTSLGSGQTGAQDRVFLRRSEGESIPFPQAVLQRGRSITTFEALELVHKESQFTDSGKRRPTAIADLDRWELLEELRQLPTKGGPAPGSIAATDQLELIQFGARLFATRLGKQDPPALQRDRFRTPGWRVTGGDDQQRAGRAIATLYLPVSGGGFAPARQLCRSDVDVELLEDLPLAGTSLDEFLCFLGVAPGDGPVILEGGVDGVVPPANLPPPLCDPGAGETPLLRLAGRGGGTLDLRVIRTAWKIWLGAVVMSEEQAAPSNQKAGRRSAVRDQLTTDAWYPVNEVDGARPPVGLSSPPDRLSPSALVVAPSNEDRRYKLLWRGPKGKDEEILRPLGALPSLSNEDLALEGGRHAWSHLDQLAKLDLQVLQDEPDARAALRALYPALLQAFVCSAPLEAVPPLLVYAPAASDVPLGERPLAWASAEDAWLCSEADRETVRRRFPALPILVAAPEWNRLRSRPALMRRMLQVEREIVKEPLEPGTPRIDGQIRAELDGALPGLFAMAEVKQLSAEGFDIDAAFERWRSVQLIEFKNLREVVKVTTRDGAALGVRATAPSPDGEVFAYRAVGRPADESPNQILFARPLGSVSVPLHLFAEALAAAVMNVTVAGLWGHALLDYPDRLRWEALLARNEAAGLALAHKRRQRGPLTDVEEQQLRAGLHSSLLAVGCELAEPGLDMLRLLHLGPADLRVLPSASVHPTETMVRESLGKVPVPAEAFRPTFHCFDANRLSWDRWRTPRRELIVAFAKSDAVGAPEDVDAESLESFAEGRCARVAFTPEGVALDWLREWKEDLSHHDLERATEPKVVFAPVNAVPNPASGWRARRLKARGGSATSFDTPPENHWDEKARRQRARGRAAEDALVGCICRETTDVISLAGDAAWKALAAVRPDGRRARARWRVAREAFEQVEGSESAGVSKRAEKLQAALHVSTYSGNAGYDILGLRLIDGLPVAHRYEVKGIEAGNSARVFLSRNELAVWNSCAPRGGKQGTWRLVAVDQGGHASDLTALLDPLSEVPVLGQLLEVGFQVDTVMLVAEREAKSDQASADAS